jgi:sarcosine oxidase subunit gamma
MADVEISVLPSRAQVNVRIDPADGPRLAAALGGALPLLPNTTTALSSGYAAWLGPDEWLLVGDFEADAMIAALREAAAGAPLSLVDVSSARIRVRVHGRKARDVLAHGCALDLDASVFTAGRCAQTRLALANVVLIAPADQPNFTGAPVLELLVRTSFAPYVTAWLADAATEYLTDAWG